MNSRLAISVSTALVVAALLMGCGNRQDSVAPLIAGAIVITTPDGAVPVTGTMQFVATVTDASGNVIALAPTWRVVNGGGTITPDGLFTAGDSAGTFINTIVATSGAVTATSSVTVSAGALATITVTPATISLMAGATQHFVAVGRDAHGNVVVAPNRVWSVAALGGTIDTGGVFTAGVTAGTFASTVTATSGALSGTASVTVSGGPMVSMVVTPATATLAIGATQQYTVVGHDANNNVVPVSPAVVWTVGGGGTMDANGLFTAGTTAGVFGNTVHAMSGLICADASVTVSAGELSTLAITPSNRTLSPLATSTFVAVGRDANNNVIAVTPTWSVVAGGGTIDAGTGVFTTGSLAGAFTNTVVATSGSHTATASLTVLHGDLTSIVLTPLTATISVAGLRQFTAVGKDAGNNVFAIDATWSVVASGGTISSTGLFTAGLSLGSFANTVRVASGSLSATATVTVVPGPATSVVLSPASVSLAFGATQHFTAVATDAHGNVLNNAPSWLVVGGGGTMPEDGGLYTAGAIAGTYTNSVTAQVGSVTGTATVIVTPAIGPLATIAVTPATTSVVPTQTRQYTAVGHDADGNVVAITPVWSVVNGGGTINGTGLLTAATLAGSYSNTVQATSGAISGTASVVVTGGSVTSIAVSPSTASVVEGATQQYTAVGHDTYGNVTAITPSWSVYQTFVPGTISSTGLFTAGTTPGVYTNKIAASANFALVTGFASVTVTAPVGALVRIAITPANPSIDHNRNNPFQFTATGYDASNNVVPIVPAPTWTVSGPLVGTISSTGVLDSNGNSNGPFTNAVSATSGAIVGTTSVMLDCGC